MHPHWHQGWLVGGRSRQLDLKARITGQEAQRCSRTHTRTHLHTHVEKDTLLRHYGRFIILCFLAVSFSTGRFSFWFSSARIPAVLCDRCDHLLYGMCLESPAKLKWVVGKEWLPKWTSHAKARRASINPLHAVHSESAVGWSRHGCVNMPCWNKDHRTHTHTYTHTPALSCDLVPLCFMWPVVVCWGMLNRTTNGPDAQPDDIKLNWLVPVLSVSLFLYFSSSSSRFFLLVLFSFQCPYPLSSALLS